jgi:hypothetical protein
MHLGADPAGEAVQRGVALGRGVPLLELNGLEQDSAVDRAAAVEALQHLARLGGAAEEGGDPQGDGMRAVRKVLTAGIKAEGPIHVDRLVKLTVGAFGLNRSSEARKQALLSTLPPSAVVDGYLWPEGVDPVAWTEFRRQVSSTDRPIDHVAPEEIANAMAALCRASAGMRREELLTAAAAVFGNKRRTPATTPALEAALTWALHRGRLTEQPSGLLTV